jgi:metal-sulfur cluster biosynthetic enzyme
MPQADAAPLLIGDPQLIARVLEALRQVQEAQGGHSIVDSGRVQGLDIGDGEATLTLRMGQGLCADTHWLAEKAFEALRKTLPETDLYLRHDRPMGCAGRQTGVPA